MLRRPAYKSFPVVTGVLLLVLGAGNWVAGAIRGRPYVEYLAAHPGPRSTEASWRERLLDPPDAELEARDIAHAKLDFYQLVQTGGRVMILAGIACLVFS